MIEPITLKTGATILLSGASLTASSVSVIVYKEKIKDFFNKTFDFSGEIDDFGKKFPTHKVHINDPFLTHTTFLVKKTKNTKAGITTDRVLYEKLNKEKIKKFKCKLSDQKIDDECEIYELEKNAHGLIDLKTIQHSLTKTDKLGEEDKYYRLDIKNTLLKDMTFEDMSMVDIVSQEDESVVLETLKVDYQIKNHKVEGKTNLLIAKIIPELQSVNEPTFFCTFDIKSSDKQKICKLFKIASNDKNFKHISLSTTSEMKTIDNIQNDYFFVIDIQSEVDVLELHSTNPIYVAWQEAKKPIKIFEVAGWLSKTVKKFSPTKLSEVIFSK